MSALLPKAALELSPKPRRIWNKGSPGHGDPLSYQPQRIAQSGGFAQWAKVAGNTRPTDMAPPMNQPIAALGHAPYLRARCAPRGEQRKLRGSGTGTRLFIARCGRVRLDGGVVCGAVDQSAVSRPDQVSEVQRGVTDGAKHITLASRAKIV